MHSAWPNFSESAHGGRHLIHQTGGLAKINVLGKLGDLRDLHCAYLTAVVQVGKDSSDQNLERRRGGKSAALHYVGGGVRAEAADLHSFLLEACCNAAYQRSGGVLLLGHDRKLGKIHAVLGEALGLDHDLVVLGRFNYGDDIKVYAGCEYLAVVVVGVVSAYLGSSRRGKESVLADGAEMLRECGHCTLVALLL